MTLEATSVLSGPAEELSHAYGSSTFAMKRELYEYFDAQMRTAGAQRRAFEVRFARLAERWREETMFVSSLREMIEHPTYQAIIRMGREVVPLILHALEKTPEHWGAALQAITGENPVPEDAHGRVDAIAKAWVKWGSDHDYLP